MQPVAKTNDPVTSWEAGEDFAKSPKKNQHYKMILVTLSDTFPYSSAEIAKWTPLNRWQIARRMSETEKAGWVRRTQPKPCSVTKRRCVGWLLTGKGRDYIDNELLFV